MKNQGILSFDDFPRDTLIKMHDFIVSKNFQVFTSFFISRPKLLSEYFASFPTEQFKNATFWEDEKCTSLFTDLPNEFFKLPENIQRYEAQKSIICFRNLKDHLQIPITCDLNELDFAAFYTPKNAGFSGVRDIGASLIAPDVALHATPKDERIAGHDSLFDIMVKNLYDIECSDIYDADTKIKTREVFLTYRKDFVYIRHISNTNNLFAVITIPTYVTPFQFKELERLNSILKQLNVRVHTSYAGSALLSSEFPTLEQVLEHLKIYDYIKENALPLKKRTEPSIQNQI